MTPEERRKITAEYIRERLQRETQGRGSARRLAEESGVTGGHIAHIKQGQKIPGPSVIERLAKFWGIDTRELEDEAVRTFKERPAAEQSAIRAKMGPGQNRARAEAAMMALGYPKDDVARWADAVAATLRPGEDPDAETWWLPLMISTRRAESAATPPKNTAGQSPRLRQKG